ncbi:hypothetical protein V8C86DRAFT_3146508 [Haematococcus lacustris]
MHEAVTRQFLLLAFYLSWIPVDVAELLLGEMVAAGMAGQTGVRIVGQLGFNPGWKKWGPYCGLLVDWCNSPGADAVSAFVAFNLRDMQLALHRDKGDVNVGRVVFNLGGGGVVNLKCDEELCYGLDHGWGYFIGPVASGKAPVTDGVFCRHSVGIQPGFSQPHSGMVATCSLIIDVNSTTWNVSAPPPPSLWPPPISPLILDDWVLLRGDLPQNCKGWVSVAWKQKAARVEANQPPTQRDKKLQAGRVATGRAVSEAWKQKAARVEANQPPTQRDKKLQAGKVAAALTLKRQVANASGLLGYEDTMRS